MVTLQTFTTTGKECPKCKNHSIFSEKIFKFLGFTYSHTLDECKMDNRYCNYKEIKYDK